jgi:TolB-like protein/tetratricopeptide (TPR) repeat protein
MSEQNAIRPEAARAQLDRILLSPGLAASPRLCSLLRYLVDQTLNGTAADIKEYSIGLEVFRLPPSFDPKTQSIVRSTAGKLREKLAEYYQGPGLSDPIVIDIPKGAYVPRFRTVRKSAPGWIWPAAAAAALVLVAMGALGWRGAISDPHPSVAVLDIRNASGNENNAWLSTALAEMLTENLSAARRLRTIPTEQVAEWRRELRAPDLRAQLANRGRALQDRLSASYAVLADFSVTGEGADPPLRVNTQVLRLRDGKILAQASDTGSEAQIYSLTSRMAARVFAALGVARDGDGVQCSGPNCESMRLYSEALVKLREYDPVAASKLLEQSVVGDESNFMARSVLAETYKDLGQEAQASIQAQAALKLVKALPPLERLPLEARCQNAMMDRESAIRSYRRLWRTSPESIDYGLKLARLQEQAGLLPEAVRTLSEVRKQGISTADEARVDFDEALLHRDANEQERCLALARQCRDKAKSLGWLSLYARARLRESGSISMLGQPGELPPLEEALAVCRQQGYHLCELIALAGEGNYFITRDPKRALEVLRQGADLARQVGNSSQFSDIRWDMAYLAVAQLSDDDAERYFLEAIPIVHHQRRHNMRMEAEYARLLVEEGRLRDADRVLYEAGDRAQRDIDLTVVTAFAETNRGDNGSAGRRVDSAVALARKGDLPWNLTYAISEAVSIQLGQVDTRRAITYVTELERSGVPSTMIPGVRTALALACSRWDEANAQALAARGVCRSVHDFACEAKAATMQAEAQVGARRPAEALRTLDEFAAPLERSRRVPWQLRARAIRYRAQALLGSCPSGPQIRDLMDSAQKLGIPWLSREINAAARQIHGKCNLAVSAMAEHAGTPSLH